MKKYLSYLLLALGFPLSAQAQGSPKSDSTLNEVTLKAAVEYAIQHQPLVRQALIDEEITRQQIKTRLADWYPQIGLNANIQHTFIRPTSIIGGNPVTFGVKNSSAAQFKATQNIFNRDALLASRTREDVLLRATENTIDTKIDLTVAVAKRYYDILGTLQQIRVSGIIISRIERSLQDAYNQYQAGIADKTDYKRAQITLNNSKATKQSNENLLTAKLEQLKALMNYPLSQSLNIVYDSLAMERQLDLDTLQNVNYIDRVEYSQLATERRLLIENIRYNKWSFLPTVQANGAYIANYQNNEFPQLYKQTFPNSYAGISLGFPIFQGGKRLANIKIAKLELDRNDWDITNLENNINAEYENSLGQYKSNLTNYLALKENVALAQEVYDVIQLQYKSGIKTYLEVLISDTELRTAQINYYNALYEVLASKIDVEKALGTIKY